MGASSARGATASQWLAPVSGNWSDPASWSTNPAYPNNGAPPSSDTYDVSIDATGAGYTVSLVNDPVDVTVDSIALDSANATFRLAGSNLQVNGSFDVRAGTFRMDSGRLANTRITTAAGAVTQIAAGTLDNVTFAGAAALLGTFTGIIVNNGLTLANNAALSLNDNRGGVYFGGVQTLGGNGTVTFDTPNTVLPNVIGPTSAAGNRLTIGSDITIRAGTTGGTIGTGLGAITNQGTILANAAGKVINFRGLDSVNAGTIRASTGIVSIIGERFVNTGLLQLTGGGSLDIAGSGWINEGVVESTPGAIAIPNVQSSGHLSINGTNWKNRGTIHFGGAGGSIYTQQDWENEGTVKISSGTVFLSGRMLARHLGHIEVTGGQLYIDTSFELENQTFDIAALQIGTFGGRFTNGTVTSATGAVLDTKGRSAALENVTLAADMTLVGGGKLTIEHGLTLAGSTIRTDVSGGVVERVNSWEQTIGGNGTIVIDSRPLASNTQVLLGGYEVTFGPGVTIRTGAEGGTNNKVLARMSSHQGTAIAQTRSLSLEFVSLWWNNSGTIRATTGGAAVLNNTWSNNAGGAILATGAGSTVTLNGAWSNAASATISAADGGAAILNGKWTNNGSIAASNGGAVTVTSVPADPWTNAAGATISATGVGSTTTLGGAWTNSANAAINAAGGGVVTLRGKWTNNGVIAATTGGGISVTSVSSDAWANNGTISGDQAAVTLNGSWTNNAQVTTSGGTLNLSGSWTNGGHVTTNGSVLSMGGSWTSNGQVATTGGTLNLSGTWLNTGTIATSGSTVSLAGVSSGFGTFNLTDSAVTVSGSYTTAQLNSLTLTNSTLALVSGGTIQNAGATLTVSPTFPLQLKSGTITGGTLDATPPSALVVAPAATVTLDSVVINAPVTVEAGASLVFSGAWRKNAAITANDATLTFGGTFTHADIGTLQRTGGVMRISGVLENTSSAFPIDRNGKWELAGGTIMGGTVASSVGGAVLDVVSSPNPATLNGVTLDCDLNVATTGNVVGGLTLLGKNVNVNAGSATTAGLAFYGTQTLGGSGEVVFGGSQSGFIQPAGAAGGTLTIGPDISVRTGALGGTVGATGFTTLNRGVISAQTTGRTLTLLGSINNQGLIEASNGATVRLGTTNAPGAFSNFSGGTLSGGRWSVGSNSAITTTTAISVITNAADVRLSGVVSSFAAVNNLAVNLGTFTIENGRNFTTVGAFTNAGALNIGAGSTFTSGGTLTWSDGTISGAGRLVAASAKVAGNVSRIGGGASKFTALAVTAGKHLDLTTGKLITREPLGTASGGVYTGVQGLVQSGFDSGVWDGAGIVTTTADAAKGLTSLGVAAATQAGYVGRTFGGISVAAGDVLVMYTYAGDANLDGFISGDDYAAIDFNIAVPGAFGWYNGDFNYDGIISGDDYSVIDFNLIAQGAPFPTAGPAAQGGVIAVPEPCVAAIGVGLLGLARRRRRHNLR